MYSYKAGIALPGPAHPHHIARSHRIENKTRIRMNVAIHPKEMRNKEAGEQKEKKQTTDFRECVRPF